MHEPDTAAINAGTKPEIGYEHRDIQVMPIIVSTFWFFAGTVATIIASLIGVVTFVDLPLRPEQKPASIPLAPNPLLQGTMAVKVDIAKVKNDEHRKLDRYGWVDRQKGVAQIPIDKAIDLIAERGVNPQPSVPPTEGGQL